MLSLTQAVRTIKIKRMRPETKPVRPARLTMNNTDQEVLLPHTIEPEVLLPHTIDL